MTVNEGIFFVPAMSMDNQVRVFRRTLNATEEFEGLDVDAYIVITRSHLVVCDTMLCPEDVAAMMQMVQHEIADRIVLVVNSHADWDHAWGNAFFRGKHTAPIIAHEHGLVRMQSQEARQELSDFQRRHPAFRNVELVPPTITFKHGLTIHDSDLTIELFSTPGHHRDHIAAWLPELGVLLAFDAVEKPLPCIENAAAVPAMFATLEHLLALQPGRVLCSHGKTTSSEIIKENLAYLREIERRSRTALLTHRPTEQELEHADEFIQYPFDKVIASSNDEIDRTFYSRAHNTNIRYMLEWLIIGSDDTSWQKHI